MSADLSKVDSAVAGLGTSPEDKKPAKERKSSSNAGVYNINDLGLYSLTRDDQLGYGGAPGLVGLLVMG